MGLHTNGAAAPGLAGIPCIGLGPGDEGLAHTANEHCPVAHLCGGRVLCRLGGAAQPRGLSRQGGPYEPGITFSAL